MSVAVSMFPDHLGCLRGRACRVGESKVHVGRGDHWLVFVAGKCRDRNQVRLGMDTEWFLLGLVVLRRVHLLWCDVASQVVFVDVGCLCLAPVKVDCCWNCQG